MKYRTILVVEDEATLRRLIARNLSARGHNVQEAETAGEALDSVIKDPPDLILLDINLPDQSGWNVMREMRRHGLDVPTIVVSAVRVSQTGCDHPLLPPKAFPAGALLAPWQRRLTRRASGRAASERSPLDGTNPVDSRAVPVLRIRAGFRGLLRASWR
jgi:DNA-binding response OmpR family regulator